MQTLTLHFTPDPASVARAVSIGVQDPGDVAWLFGPANLPARSAIMFAITGKVQPKAKCGINAVMAALYTVFPVPSYTCIADKERQLGELIRAANVPVKRLSMKSPLPILYTPAAAADFARGYESSDTPPHSLRYFYDAPENGRVTLCITEDEAEDFWRIRSIDLESDVPSPEHFAALLEFTANALAIAILEALTPIAWKAGQHAIGTGQDAALFNLCDATNLLPWVEHKTAPDVAAFHAAIISEVTAGLTAAR